MNLGETDVTKIRVPIFLVLDADGSPVTGYTPGAHELQTSRTATSWSDAAGTLVELGNGDYYYQGVAGDASVEGFLAVAVNKTGYRAMAYAPIIGASGTLWIPLCVYNAGSLASGAAPTGAQLKVSKDGAALVNAAGTWHEITGGAAGGYYYVHDVTNPPGITLIVVNEPGYDIASAWGSINASSDTTAPSVTISAPGGSNYDSVKDQPVTVTVSDSQSAITFVSISVQFVGSAAPETIYVGGGDAAGFRGIYGHSMIAGAGGVGAGYTFSITRDGGWPKGVSATFSVRAVDAAGNVTA